MMTATTNKNPETVDFRFQPMPGYETVRTNIDFYRFKLRTDANGKRQAPKCRPVAHWTIDTIRAIGDRERVLTIRCYKSIYRGGGNYEIVDGFLVEAANPEKLAKTREMLRGYCRSDCVMVEHENPRQAVVRDSILY